MCLYLFLFFIRFFSRKIFKVSEQNYTLESSWKSKVPALNSLRQDLGLETMQAAHLSSHGYPTTPSVFYKNDLFRMEMCIC
jgi:hypothetical protein